MKKAEQAAVSRGLAGLRARLFARMPRRVLRRYLRARRLVPFAGVAALVAVAYLAGVLEPLDERLTDARFRLLERPASGELVIVAIDDESLRSLGDWPWDRGRHATVLENLRDAGADRVALTLHLSSRSIPEADLKMNNALAAADGRVILPLFKQTEWSGGGRATPMRPLQAFLLHSTLATIDAPLRPGGTMRRHRLTAELDNTRVPSLAFALSGLSDPGFDSFYVDLGIDPESIPRISYADVLNGTFDAELFRGNAVIVGLTATELADHVSVSGHGALPVSVVQALAFESLVQGRTLQTGSPIPVVLGIVLLGLATGVVVGVGSPRMSLLLVSAVIAGAFLLALVAQSRSAILIDVSPWMLAPLGNLALVTMRSIDRRRINQILRAPGLRRSQVLMRHVAESCPDGILIVDRDGVIQAANSTAESLFDLTATELTGTDIFEITTSESASSASQRWSETCTAGRESCEGVARRADGTTVPVEIVSNRVLGDAGGKRVCFLRDIQERKAKEHALKYQATHDSLTRLPNRVLLRERVEEALREAEPDGSSIAFMILDLDRFKEINDTLGHEIGDQALKEVAERLLGQLRDCDTIARLSGDEFAVVVPRIRVAEAHAKALELIDALTEHIEIYGLLLRVKASIGIAMFPAHGKTAAELIQRADVAMYAAKHDGSRVSVYHAEQDFTNIRHLALSGELKKAIEDDRLMLYYQPKIACDMRCLAGVEALVRWNHPEYGLLSPDRFISVAEHSGLIKPLLRWVLRVALQQCSKWQRQGLPIGVAVNLSARNLEEEDLPQQVTLLLEDFQVAPQLLTLEVTESAFMENPQCALSIVEELTELGVRISIDDFGTGYSSLSYLKRLPAREIKIDRTLITEICQGRDDAVIVQSTIEMAHGLGMSVVAEGIESAEVLDRLSSFRCDTAQGHFFSPPLPADSFLQWMNSSPWKPARDRDVDQSCTVA
jgi:diguanylate cyclase (GGDEF)-like protein/PAS domain S-box-containing protein